MVLDYFKVLWQYLPVELRKIIPIRTANLQAEILPHDPPKYETTVLTIKTFGKPDSDIQKEDAPLWTVSLQVFLCYWSEA